MSKVNTHLDALKKLADAARHDANADDAAWFESQYEAWCEVRNKLETLGNRLDILEAPKSPLLPIEPENQGTASTLNIDGTNATL